MSIFLFCYLSVTPVWGETKSAPKAKDKQTQPDKTTQKNTKKVDKKTSLAKIDFALIDQQQTEMHIRQALDEQDWYALRIYLKHYETIEKKDNVLWHFAKGIDYLVQHQYDVAITELRAAIALDPSNIDVRTAMAIALYENKEYEAAQDQFYKINSAEIPERNRQIIERYQAKILRDNNWDYSLNFDFMNSNKISDDSYERVLQVSERDPSRKMLHSTLGVGYKFGISKNFLLKENHYIVPSVELKGWSYSESGRRYTEGTFDMGIGYLYMTPDILFKITPNAQKTLVNHSFFVSSYGIDAEVRHPINDNWQSVNSYSFAKKNHYNYLYKDFDGQAQDVGLTFINIYSPVLKMWIGAHYSIDRVRARSESSNKKGIELGMANEWPLGISSQLTLKYNQRDYLANHLTLRDQRRNDDDYIATISLWHRNLYIFGITPRVNYMYRNIESSIPTLYNQRYHQFFVTLEKNF